jgi:YcxB-like protein
MTNEGSVQGTAELAELDFRSAWRFVPTMKTLRTLGLLGGLAYPLLLLLGGFMSGGEAVAAALSVVVVLAATWTFSLRAAAKKLSRASGGITQFHLDPALGFSVHSPSRDLRLAWGSLVRFIETPDSFLVYGVATPVVVVPKRAFSADGTARARQLLSANVAATMPNRGRGLRIGAGVFFVLVAVSSVHHWLRFVEPHAAGDGASSVPER